MCKEGKAGAPEYKLLYLPNMPLMSNTYIKPCTKIALRDGLSSNFHCRIFNALQAGNHCTMACKRGKYFPEFNHSKYKWKSKYVTTEETVDCNYNESTCKI